MKKSASMLQTAQHIEVLYRAAADGNFTALIQLARLALETLKHSDELMWPDAAEEILQYFERLAPREADGEESDAD